MILINYHSFIFWHSLPSAQSWTNSLRKPLHESCKPVNRWVAHIVLGDKNRITFILTLIRLFGSCCDSVQQHAKAKQTATNYEGFLAWQMFSSTLLSSSSTDVVGLVGYDLTSSSCGKFVVWKTKGRFPTILAKCLHMPTGRAISRSSPDIKDEKEKLWVYCPLFNSWHYALFIFRLPGRAIRHRGDYATILLLDQRYGSTRIKKNLPGWISNRLQHHARFGSAFAAIRKVSH